MENDIKTKIDTSDLANQIAKFIAKLKVVPREFVDMGVTIHLSAKITMVNGEAVVTVFSSTELSDSDVRIFEGTPEHQALQGFMCRHDE
jgi:hypothetical protein